MLSLVTGVPGSGKTLWTIARLEKLGRDTGRPVFYNGIELTVAGKAKLGWHSLEVAEKWYELGATSIVVIDEAQRVFRPRTRGADVPLHFAEFETHRHGGIDVYLLTQNPMLIDSHVRKLVGKHYHIRRTFGMNAAKVSEWDSRVAGNPDKKSEYMDAREARWTYPKEVYELYVSAEVHTHGKDLPWRQIAWIGGLSVGVIFGIWEVVHWGQKPADGVKVPAGAVGVISRSESEGSVGTWSSRRTRGNPWSVEVQRPRVAGVPMTAAFYDELQVAQQQPAVAGCWSLQIDSALQCHCHTSQGSKIEMSVQQCQTYMREGWFDPTAKREDLRALQRERLDAKEHEGSGGFSGAPRAEVPASPVAALPVGPAAP